MGVTTTADEKLEEAKKAVQLAVENLSQIVVTREVWGWDDYNASYTADLRDALNNLMQVRVLLGE